MIVSLVSGMVKSYRKRVLALRVSALLEQGVKQTIVIAFRIGCRQQLPGRRQSARIIPRSKGHSLGF
jgi:hypothetical protein